MTVAMNRADRVVLHNITWEQFENLLKDLGEKRAARVAYFEGTLEIMTPLPEHEYYKEVIGVAVQDIAEELELNYESYGSTTWKRERRKAGLEPDNCFYFQNEAAIRGRLDFDLNQDPPPDLALEIDITNKSLNRFPIYARLGVPELWCYDNGELKIYHLQDGEYVEGERSLVFHNLPIQELPQVIEEHRSAGRLAVRRAVREWVRERRS
ncbi:MAG: Uma2 family endonuclease [Nostocaceae cyanobacterium]|nr:Uma2 family endonuclease [Nostocaceae cyanobacterium]